MIHTTQETDDDVKQAYLLLLQAKKQIESDEKEIERLKKQYTDHLELDADESMEFQAKYQMRVSERDYWMNRYTEICDGALSVFVEFGCATPERAYREQPGLLLSDLRNFISNLRNAAIAEYQLRVTNGAAWKAEIEKLRGDEAQQRFRAEQSEQQLVKMIAELKAVDMGDSETRIRIYHVLNKYNML
jgi:hypothetical protein